jgi:transposase
MMRCYNQSHRFYCGIDLHAKTMHVCILDNAGAILFHHNLKTNAGDFLHAVRPFRQDLVVTAECTFHWYWLADLCIEHSIPFVLGHALYMKAIHGGKSKTDKIDSEKIARLLRGGNLPMAYVYPKGMRETRDLLRRRMYLVHKRAETITHIQNTNSQYNLPPFGQKIAYGNNRKALKVADRFTDPSVRKSIEVDLALLDHFDEQLRDVELYLLRHAKIDDGDTFHRLRSIPGVGQTLAMVLLYEIHHIERFASVGNFLSYARLVRPTHESAGKKKGFGCTKIGNAHLRWAFAEAVCLLLRQSERAKKWMRQREKKSGKPKAMGILAAKLGRAVYWMLHKKETFNEERFFAS